MSYDWAFAHVHLAGTVQLNPGQKAQFGTMPDFAAGARFRPWWGRSFS